VNAGLKPLGLLRDLDAVEFERGGLEDDAQARDRVAAYLDGVYDGYVADRREADGVSPRRKSQIERSVSGRRVPKFVPSTMTVATPSGAVAASRTSPSSVPQFWADAGRVMTRVNRRRIARISSGPNRKS
jgi:hypothetical protein